MRFRRLIRLVPLAFGSVALTAVGCQSPPQRQPAPHASSDGLSDSDSANMAAQDADNLKLKQSQTEPVRRPAPTPERRPVDQPRIRG